MSAALRSFENLWNARGRDPWFAVREPAMRKFLNLGLPTTRDESWRYTNVRALETRGFGDAPERSADATAASAAGTRGAAGTHSDAGASRDVEGSPYAPGAIAAAHANPVLLVNGRPASELNLLNDSHEIRSLRDISLNDSKSILPFLTQLPDTEPHRFSLLNTALFRDGLHIKVMRPMAQPLVIQHLAAGRENEIAHPRVIIEVAADASATVIEHHVGGTHGPVVNSDAQLLLARAARLEHYRVFSTGAKATHFDSLRIQQGQDSHCRQFTVALGGGLLRTTLEARLNERGALLDSHALLVGHENRHVDCVNIAVHAAPDTHSRQTARAIASGASRVIFNSKVVVQAGAVRSDSQQSCRGLLLSPTAEIDSRPQLEIHADEVKCAHGATIGRLDPDMLFYLLSRGLERDTAQILLVYAFLADVLTGMTVASARGAIESALIQQLPDSQLLQDFR